MTFEEAEEKGIVPWGKIVLETKNILVYKDGYPVSEGHMLFVPKDDSPYKITKCFQAAYLWGERDLRMNRCDGFNIGQNMGKAAGQTIMYPHIHYIPRYHGDVQNPRGGVRHVIPSKADY